MEPNRWSLFDYLHVGVSGFPLDGLVSIDVTLPVQLTLPPGDQEKESGMDKTGGKRYRS